MSKKKRTAVERWNGAVVEAEAGAAEQALAEVLAMSDEQVERQLALAGADVAAVDARAGAAFDAWRARAKGEEAEPPSTEGGAWVAPVEGAGRTKGVPRRGRQERTRVIALTAAAAAAAATVGVATYLGTRAPPETPDVKTPDVGPAPKVAPSADPVAEGRALRAEALAACARGAFRECLDGLDAARGRDPKGDDAAEVRAARQRAGEGLAKEEKQKRR